MTPPPDEPRRVLHPRDLVCPRCGADVDRPCSFSGRVQREIHCTERLLALGDPELRVRSRPAPPAQQAKPGQTEPKEAKPSPEPPKKRRPLPSRSAAPPASSPGDADQQAPLTLFG